MYRLAAIPFVVLLLPLLAGIFIGGYCAFTPVVWIVLGSLLVLSVVLACLLKKVSLSFFSLAVGICVFAFGWLRAEQQWQQTEVDYLGKTAVYELWLQEVPLLRERSVRCEAQVMHCLSDSTWQPSEGRIMLYLWRDSLSEQLSQGDRLLVQTTIERRNNGNPSEFDYAAYLRLQGIAGTAYAYADAWEKTGTQPLHTLRGKAQQWQYNLVELYRRHGQQDAVLGVLSALTLGDKELLDADTKQAYSAAGAMHILAVSGLHVGIIYGVVWLLLTGFGVYPALYRQHWRRWLQAVVVVVCLWLYAFLTGLSPSVMRSALMLSLLCLGNALGRHANVYNTIAASAFISLLINPLTLFSVSFQLSYAAVLAIVYYQPRFYHCLPALPWGARQVWSLITVSVAAQIGTLPFTLYYFAQTSNYFILTNLIVIPAATVIVYTALLLLLLSWTPIAFLPAALLRWELQGLNGFVTWIEHLPHATTHISLNTGMFCTLLVFMLLLTLFCARRKWYWLAPVAVSLVVLFVLYHVRLQAMMTTEQLVVYNTRNYNLLLYQQGNKAVAYTDDTLQAPRQMKDYCNATLLPMPVLCDISDSPFFAFRWKEADYLLVRDSVLVNKTIAAPMPVHGLLLGDIGRISPERLLRFFQPDTVFLLSSMRRYKAEQMEQYMQQRQIPYITAADSAIILK